MAMFMANFKFILISYDIVFSLKRKYLVSCTVSSKCAEHVEFALILEIIQKLHQPHMHLCVLMLNITKIIHTH
jgi:hypothetical protein